MGMENIGRLECQEDDAEYAELHLLELLPDMQVNGAGDQSDECNVCLFLVPMSTY
jgi:hypothetical protein